MSIWAIIIAILSLLIVVGNILGLGSIFQTILSYLILLVALAILHRIWSRTKSGRFELICEQLEELRKENDELRERLGED